jgi:hypothetical protein
LNRLVRSLDPPLFFSFLGLEGYKSGGCNGLLNGFQFLIVPSCSIQQNKKVGIEYRFWPSSSTID